MPAGTHADVTMLDLVGLAGVALAFLSAFYLTYDLFGSERLRLLTLRATFAVVGALAVGFLYVRLFASPTELAHPLTASPLYAGLLLGFLAGVVGGMAPVTVYTLARGQAFHQEVLARREEAIAKSEQVISSSKTKITEARERQAGCRTELARGREAVRTEQQAIATLRRASPRGMKLAARRERRLKVAQEGLAKLESDISALEQQLGQLESDIAEAERFRKELAEHEVSDVALPGLPFSKREYAAYAGQFAALGGLVGFVGSLSSGGNIGFALYATVGFAIGSFLLYTVSMHFYAFASRRAGHVVGSDDSASHVPALFSLEGCLIGAVAMLIPACMQFALGMPHNIDVGAIRVGALQGLLDVLAGGVVGGISPRITGWTDKLGKRQYLAIGFGLATVGSAMAALPFVLHLASQISQ